MNEKPTESNTARIFREANGYHWSPDSLDYLDARGTAYKTKADALRAAFRCGYTHAVGAEIAGRRAIDKLVSLSQHHHVDHERALELEGRPL